MMMSQTLLFFILCQVLAGLTMYNSNSVIALNDVISVAKEIVCDRTYNLTWMEFICSDDDSFNDADINIDDLNSTILESIQSLSIKGEDSNRGPMSTIPPKICRFSKLKELNLSRNNVRRVNFTFITPCLSELRSLDLSGNFITDISTPWLKQMPLLEYISLSNNNLIDLPYDIFHNISYLRTVNVTRNNLRTIELWTIYIQDTVDYRGNSINRFSNKYNVDLSHLQTLDIPTFSIDRHVQIQFDDTIFAMYNRCAEVHNIPNFFNTYIPTLTRAVLSIIKNTDNGQSFYIRCSCDQYYFYQTAFAIDGYPTNDSFENWKCPGRSIKFVQKCNNRSSARFKDVIPRLCKIDDSELGYVPVYAPGQGSTTRTTSVTTTQSTSITAQSTTELPQQTTTTTTTTTTVFTTTISNFPKEPDEIKKYLEEITELNNSTIQNFTYIINNAHNNLNITSGSSISENTKIIYQKIIQRIENLIESVNSSLNISDVVVALVSSTKTNPIYHFDQLTLSNSSKIYSSESEYANSTASISIDEKYINQLSDDKFYNFYFLPSSFFHYAQIDSRIEIISPIVGASLLIEQSLHVQMSFHDDHPHRSSGSYSCVFWQNDRWNNTGCIYSNDSITNRHYCHCDHLTSFALIFTPDGILRETFLPTIITSCFSIIGIFISIIFSVYQLVKPQVKPGSRRFSIDNIISSSSTLILFILFTTLLIINYQSTTIQLTTSTACPSSKLNLVLATYFFIILTFATKTLLGIYFYFRIFVQVKLALFNDRSNKWYLVSILMIIIIALIPTIVASALSHQRNNVIVSNNNICWFHGIYLINFVIIPVSIFMGINVIIMILISICLCQFSQKPHVGQSKENRLIIGTCMWIASCVLLGILWIVGPLLNLFVNENGQSTSTASKAMQWMFALLSGLEGVWVLIVNILFYVRQRSKQRSRRSYSSNDKKKWHLIDDSGRSSINMHDNQKETNDYF